MNCCVSADDLDLYHAGQLSEADTGRIQQHLQTCQRCAALDRKLVAVNERLLPQVQAVARGGAVVAEEETSAATSALDSEEDLDPTAPEIPGYRILRKLHRGGQGVVYLAHQTSTKRKVAIKVMVSGRFASPSAQKRFEREIEIVAQLKHNNIISIFHSGRLADGLQFYVMDYVRGSRVDHYVRDKKLGLRDTLELFADICEAVQYAHQRGVIHRDLKPSNIMVDADGRPRILDFGLAKMMAGPEESVVSLTAEIIGTLPYMSPEQARGTSDEVDTRTDIYALGVMLYEVLTGGYPYPVVGNVADVLHNITDTPPTPPSRVWDSKSGVHADHSRGLRSGRCPIDNEVQTIVLKSLSKQRERRYQSAGELGRDLRHYVADEPIEAKRDSALYVMRKRLHRHRGKVVVAAGFGLLALCFGAYAYAVEKQRSVEKHLTRGKELRDNGHFVEAEKQFEAARMLDPENFEAVYLKAHALSEYYRDQEYAFASPEMLGRIAGLCSEASTLDPQRHAPWNLLCTTQYHLGEIQAAEQSCREALRLKPNYHYAWSNLARVQALGHHFAEARASFADGVAQLENLPEEEFRRINDDGIYRARGALLLFLGDEQAADALERAAEIDPSDGNNFWMLGRLHLGQGKFDDALDDVQQALSLRKIDDPRYSRIAALAYLRGGEVAPALSHANTAIDLAAAEDIADRSAHHSLGALVHTAFARVTKALAHAELDQTHEATAELDLALRNWPPFGEDGVFVESEKQLLWFDTEEDLEVLVSEAWRRLGLEPKRRMPGEHDEE